MLAKIFKTRKKKYLYDTNKNTILSINDEQYEALDKMLNKHDNSGVDKLKDLYDAGYLAENRIKKIVHSADEKLEYHLENNVSMLILQVTQQCNFRCEYCTYSGSYFNRKHSNKKMDAETALKGIDFLIEHSSNLDRIYIGFYGGEPLLAFDLVKECIEYAEKKAEGKEVIFSMTTNASLLTEEKRKFFSQHNIQILISLDGPKEIQDSHRIFAADNKGTFEKVTSNIKDLKEKQPELLQSVGFNSVVDTKNDFDKINNFFSNDELVSDMRTKFSLIQDGFNNSKTVVEYDYYVKSEYQFFRMLLNIIRNGNMDGCSKVVRERYTTLERLSKKLTNHSAVSEVMNPSGQCIAGTVRLFLNADGNFYPCEKSSEASEELKIGSLEEGFDVEKVRKITNIAQLNQERCKNCWSIRLCGMCAAILYRIKTNDYKKNFDHYCNNIELSSEEDLKNYCVLREFGHKFPEEVYNEYDTGEFWM